RAHIAKERSLAVRERHLLFFMVQVDLVFKMVRGAPFSLRLKKASGEHPRKNVIVIRANPKLLGREMNGNPRMAARRRLCEQSREWPHVIAFDLLEASEKGGSPGQPANGIVRLVA